MIFKLKRKAGKGSLVIWFCALFSLAKWGERRCKRKISRFFTFPQAQKAPHNQKHPDIRTKSSVFNSDDADGSDNLCLELFKIVSGFLCLSRRGLLGLHKQAGISQIAFFRTFFSKKVHKSSSIQINNCINPKAHRGKFRGALWGLGIYEWGGEWDQSNIPPRFQSFSLSRRVTSQAESSETAL